MKTRISFVIVIFLITNQLYAQKLTAFKNAKGLFGYMDSKTKSTVIEPIYSDAHGFSYGYAAVKKSGKWFYIDKSGKSICDKKFDKAGDFNQYGNATVSFNGEWGTLKVNCELAKASGTTKKILEQSYIQEESLGWSLFENDGNAEMKEGVDWNDYANKKLAKSVDDLFENKNKTEQKLVPKKYYHPNNQPSAEGNEVNGEKEGKWIFYNEKGYLTEISHYTKGIAHGNYFFYYTNDNIVKEQGKFVNGKKEGEVVFYFPNGKKSFTEFYENGNFVSIGSIYGKSGNLISSNGNGKVQTFFPSGQLKYDCLYVDKFQDGVCTWYHDNGLVKQKIRFKYSPEKKMSMRWDIMETNTYEGKSLEKGNLKDGNGTVINYDDKNKPVSVITYIEGKAHTKEDL